MIEQDFHRRWMDRASRYPGAQPLPPDLTLHLHIDPAYASTYSGQVAAITAASLFGRMCAVVAFDAPSVPVVDPLPWKGMALDELMTQTLESTHRFGRHEQRSARREDFRLAVGPGGPGLVVHGSGWGSYYGTRPSPLIPSDEPNPYGAAFAVIAAAAHVQMRPSEAPSARCLDVYHWQTGAIPSEAPSVIPDFELGELWSVGVGSVGSCALFFLSLITRAFRAVLIDRDQVKVENVTRSALFSWEDAEVKKPKVEVAARWLRDASVERIEPHIAWLDELPERWNRRRTGTPDILVSAANERNVRTLIENGYPPLQIYATTGRNWQTTLLRHIPLIDPCSCCVPGVQTSMAPTPCATGSAAPASSPERDDVALPFLSYAAGVMTAAEITKLSLLETAASPNRVFFEPHGRRLFSVSLDKKPTCPCQRRNPAVHRAVIEGSLFARLSDQ